jgi:hypothetical protein
MALPPTGDDPQEFALWRQGVGLMIRAASQTPIPGQVSLILRAAWSEQARDLTITARRIIDALAECGVIEHAAQVMRLRSEWTAYDVAAGSADVWVKQISPPAMRLRIASSGGGLPRAKPRAIAYLERAGL